MFEVEPVGKRQPQARPAAVDKRFRAFDPHQVLLLPPALDDWLPQDHLARFVADLDLVDKVLDLGQVRADYTDKRGYPPYDPRLMLRLLIYRYTTGVRVSRAIEQKCADDIAFRFLAADQAPGFRSISRFRRLDALAALFTQSLHLAQKLGMVKMGRIALDGTKLEANASKHKAMSYGRLVDEEERIEAEDQEFGIDGKDTACLLSATGARSAWPGCRPPARRSRPKPPTKLERTPKTRSAIDSSEPAPTMSRPSPTPTRSPPRRRVPSPRPGPTPPTPTRGS